MSKTELVKYQKYEDIFNSLSGSDLEKLSKIANNYDLYRYKTGIDSPFETKLMQTMVDNADFLGKWIIKLIDQVNGIPDETDRKGESLSTHGVKDDTEWGITLTTPSKLNRNYIIKDDPDVNHALIGPFDTNGFLLTVPNDTILTIY